MSGCCYYYHACGAVQGSLAHQVEAKVEELGLAHLVAAVVDSLVDDGCKIHRNLTVEMLEGSCCHVDEL